MVHRVKKLFLALFALLAIMGGLALIECAQAEDVVPKYENSNLLLKINWFDTTKELQELLTARNEEDFYDTMAYSECEVFYEDGDDIGFCEIWVVRPKTVDKEHTKSLGHEVLHGVLGSYHKE